MALIPIMGQPVNLVPNNERAFGCEPENGYCVLYGKDDEERIMVQMRQEPCGDSLVDNGNFVADADWTHDANVVIADGKATHVVGTSGEILQDIYGAYAFGNYFSVKVTVTGLSAGTISVYIAETAATEIISENGIYTFYGAPPFDNTELRFEFSSDCDGAISAVASYKLLGDGEITAYVVDATTGAIVATPTLTLLDDYLVWSIDTDTLSEGCYNIQVIDPCAVDVGLMTEIFTDPSFANAGDWTVAGSGLTAVVSGGRFLCTSGAGTGVGTATQPFNFPVGVRTLYYVEFTTGQIESVDPNTNGGIYVDSNPFFVFNGIQPNTTYSSYGIYAADFFNGSELDQQFFFIIDDVYTAGYINEILSVSVLTVPLASGTGIYTSNCLTVATDTGNTRIVEGFADEVVENGNNKSLGFMFNPSYFWLRARLGVQFSSPHTPTSTDNNLSSNGRKKKAYAQLSKAWDLTFHAVDENMHDTIANMINCDSFQIEGNEYVTDEKEYTANYGENGINAVAESTIEVQKVDGTRFNTNQ